MKDVAVDDPTTNAGTPAMLLTDNVANGVDVPMLILPPVDMSVLMVVAAKILPATAHNIPNKTDITARWRPRKKYFMKEEI